MAKRKLEIIPVSLLKNNLLEIVRQVQRGREFRISKGGHIVAALTPAIAEEVAEFGFAPAEIMKTLVVSAEEAPWTFDSHNLK